MDKPELMLLILGLGVIGISIIKFIQSFYNIVDYCNIAFTFFVGLCIVLIARSLYIRYENEEFIENDSE